MKNRIIAFTALSTILFACNSKEAKPEQQPETTVVNETEAKPNQNTGEFDITTIPLSEVELGEFPYVNPPENYCFGYCSSWNGKPNAKDIKSTDKEFFAVNGKLMPVEGKSYKVTIEKNMQVGTEKFSRLAVQRDLDKAIKALGGVQVNNIAIPQSEFDKAGKEELTTNGYGNSIDSNLLDDIKTYVIRTKDKTVWIQFFALDTESGRITVLENSGAK